MKTILYHLRSFSQLKRCLLATAVCFLGVVLTSCNPQSPGISPVESVPLELRVSAQPDSLFTLPSGLDFSVLSRVGQGPSGSLIRWSLLDSPGNNFTAYTYDQQGHLVGSCGQTSFGYDELRLARYQRGYLAQVYTGFDYSRGAVSPRRTDGIGWVSKYEYDAPNHLKQVLIYENVGGKFKLNHKIQYEYNAAGQLQLTRDTQGLAYGSVLSYQGVYPVEISYWENGDIYQSELRTPYQTPSKPTKRTYYNQVTNPRARLHLWPQNVLTTHYPIGRGVNSLDYENFQYRFRYDAQGRLSGVQQRSLIYNTRWSEWSYQEEFTYAP